MVADCIIGVYSVIPAIASIKRGVFRINDEGLMEKRCNACSEYMPADTEFYSPYQSANGKTALHATCKFCQCEKKNAPRRNNPQPTVGWQWIAKTSAAGARVPL